MASSISALQAAFPEHALPTGATNKPFSAVQHLAKATRADSDGEAVGRCLIQLVERTSAEGVEAQMRAALSAAADGQQVAPEDEFRLVETDRQDAVSVLTRAMSCNQAYPDCELQCSTEQATVLADAFLGCFQSSSVKLFTNVTLVAGRRSWTSALGHTFEAGVIAVDDQSIGVFWLCDDD